VAVAAEEDPETLSEGDGVKRIRVHLEPRDCWVGVYVAPKAVYVCPLPFVVVRWDRRVEAVASALDPIDPFDDESVSATEREHIFMRLSELESRVAALGELHEPTAHRSPHSERQHPRQALLEQP
jgi:hypothetical protein